MMPLFLYQGFNNPPVQKIIPMLSGNKKKPSSRMALKFMIENFISTLILHVQCIFQYLLLQEHSDIRD